MFSFRAVFGLAFFIPQIATAQMDLDVKSGVELMHSIDIVVNKDLNISFDEGIDSDYIIYPNNKSNAAEVMIRGAVFEVMVDIEAENLKAFDAQNNYVFTMSDFNIANDSAGASIILTPSSDDLLYSFTVGGSVKDLKETDEHYSGLNVLNINYF